MQAANTTLHFYHVHNAFFSKILFNHHSKKQEANKTHNESKKQLEPFQLEMHF